MRNNQHFDCQQAT